MGQIAHQLQGAGNKLTFAGVPTSPERVPYALARVAGSLFESGAAIATSPVNLSAAALRRRHTLFAADAFIQVVAGLKTGTFFATSQRVTAALFCVATVKLFEGTSRGRLQEFANAVALEHVLEALAEFPTKIP